MLRCRLCPFLKINGLNSYYVSSGFEVPHGDPILNLSGSPQGLGDGVLNLKDTFQHVIHLSASDPPQSLTVSSICPQESGRGAHCLSMEGSPFWPSRYPQDFYQTPGSCSGAPASAGMSHVS